MNVFRLFKSLLPEPPLLVGDVIASSGGTVIVEMPDGGQIQARGNVSVGARVFVRDNVVEGSAPDLPVELIEV